MWKTPLNDDLGDETPYAYDTKVLYCEYKAHDVYDEKTLKDFADDLPKLIKKGGNWRYKSVPTYNTIINKWVRRWVWDDCAEQYVNDITEGHKDKALLIFFKKLLSDTKEDFQLIDSHKERIHYLKQRENEFNEDWTYKIVKLEEAIDSIWNRICERLDIKETRLNIEATTENKTSIEQTFDDIYDHYDDLIKDTENLCQLQSKETR